MRHTGPSASFSAAIAGVAVMVIACGAGLRAQPTRPLAHVTPFVETDGVHEGTQVRLALDVRLPDGVHVQADKPRDPSLIPTGLTLDLPAGITHADILYPKPTDLAQAGQPQPLAVFEQAFVIGVRVTIEPHISPAEIAIPGHLRYQACDARSCYAPARETLEWKLRVVPRAAPTPAQHADIFKQLRFPR